MSMAKKVLIVDDNQEALLSLKEGMEQYRNTFDVLIAGDGLAAVYKLARNAIDLVVTDLKMPRMDGFALLQHVQDDYPEIPVIVMSGFSTPETQVLARKRGAAGFLDKPFKIRYLSKIILTLLEKQSDGGTLRNVTSSMFLQLIEMEQKTCTLRLISQENKKRGVLFFQQGRLLDARCGQLRCEKAAYELFSWDQVAVAIQNSCPLKTNRIQKDLQSILLEAMQRKDEAGEDFLLSDETPEDTSETARNLWSRAVKDLKNFKGVDEVRNDDTWQTLLSDFKHLGRTLGAGNFAFACVRRQPSAMHILLPDKAHTVVSLGANCPRERLFKSLLHYTT